MHLTLCDSETAVAALNASVTSASLNASLLNQGFREEDNTDQTYSQEDLEYENTLRALEQEISKWIIKQFRNLVKHT